jgi:hypothetical protein
MNEPDEAAVLAATEDDDNVDNADDGDDNIEDGTASSDSDKQTQLAARIRLSMTNWGWSQTRFASQTDLTKPELKAILDLRSTAEPALIAKGRAALEAALAQQEGVEAAVVAAVSETEAVEAEAEQTQLAARIRLSMTNWGWSQTRFASQTDLTKPELKAILDLRSTAEPALIAKGLAALEAALEEGGGQQQGGMAESGSSSGSSSGSGSGSSIGSGSGNGSSSASPTPPKKRQRRAVKAPEKFVAESSVAMTLALRKETGLESRTDSPRFGGSSSRKRKRPVGGQAGVGGDEGDGESDKQTQLAARIRLSMTNWGWSQTRFASQTDLTKPELKAILDLRNATEPALIAKGRAALEAALAQQEEGGDESEAEAEVYGEEEEDEGGARGAPPLDGEQLCTALRQFYTEHDRAIVADAEKLACVFARKQQTLNRCLREHFDGHDLSLYA